CCSLCLRILLFVSFFFFSSRRRHTRSKRDWSSDVCSSDLGGVSVRPDEPVRRGLRWPCGAAVAGGCTSNKCRPQSRRVVQHCVQSEERRVGKRVERGGSGVFRKENRRESQERTEGRVMYV